MSLAVELLGRVVHANDQSSINKSTDSKEIYRHLLQGNNVSEGSSCTGYQINECEIANLQKAIDQRKLTDYTGAPYSDIVDIKITIEKSLLAYDLKRASNGKTNGTPLCNVDELGNTLDNLNGDSRKVLEHYVELLKLGYAGNMPSARDNVAKGGDNATVEEMIAAMVSKSVQCGVQLPLLNGSTLDWFNECLTTLLSGEGNRDIKAAVPADAAIKSLVENDAATALKDLQFAHGYLAKKYSEEVAQNSEAMRRMQLGEEILQRQTENLARMAREQARVNQEMSKLQSKVKEQQSTIYELEQERALLSVDRLGVRPGTGSGVGSAVPSSSLPTSPLLASPQFQQQQFQLPTSPSVSLLRAEFKKLVEDLNKRHAEELERVRASYGDDKHI